MEGLEKVYNEFLGVFEKDLEDALYNLPKVSLYYQRLLFKKKDELIDLDMKRRGLFIEKYEYYKTSYDIVLKHNEIKDFINNDKDILVVDNKISKIKLEIDKIERIIKNLDNMHWIIKDVLDLKKIEQYKMIG